MDDLDRVFAPGGALEALLQALEDLRWRGVPRDRWLSLCEELGFDRARDRPHRWA